MKKLLVIALALATLPLFGQGTSINWGATVDVNYFMMSVADTDADGTTLTPEEEDNSYFGETVANLNASLALDGGLTGGMMIGVSETSNGIDAAGAIDLDEMWVNKAGAFGQDALSFKFGKFDVPFNLNVDNSITHAFTYGTAVISSGIGAINNTWGFNVGYKVDGVGQFCLTTFEGMGGYSAADEADEDTGLFTSMALNWDTGADAFGVTGLRLVVGYAAIATDEDADNGSIISLGGTYAIPGVALVVSLEIDMSTAVTSVDQEGAMLMALGADYTINDQFSVGLKYESLAYAEDEDAGMDANTDTRICLYGAYAVAEKSAIRFEYSSSTNDYEATDWDLDTDDDEFGNSIIAIGFKASV